MASGTSQAPSTRDGVRFSALAPAPETHATPVQVPIQELAGYPDMRGKSGDLVVVQHRSALKAPANIQASLKSLGLNGVRSSSLRSSSDLATRGMIRTARDYVFAIELDEIIYKSALVEQDFEVIEFGSSTRPGGMFRRSDLEYVIYQSDRKGVLVNWSTHVPLKACIGLVTSEFDNPIPLQREESSLIVLAPTAPDNPTEPGASGVDLQFDEGVDAIVGDASRLVHAPATEILQLVNSGNFPISLCRVSFRGMTFTWREPYARFIDSDEERSEIGVYIRDFSKLDQLKEFMRRTTKPGLMELGPSFITYREKGNVKRFKL